jgi:hypothetical protein
MRRPHEISQLGLFEAGVDAEEQHLAEGLAPVGRDRELDPLAAGAAVVGPLQVRHAGLDIERRGHGRPARDVGFVE